MIQTVTYTELDNMFFETLRRAVVAAGLLPDVAAYQAGTPAVNAAAYKAAKTALRATTMLTEVFGVGSFEAKGEKTINKIVIVRGNKNAGSIGGWPATQYDPSTSLPLNKNSRFVKSFTPDNSSDIEYEIKLITNDPVWDNALSGIIDTVIPQKRFLFTVADNGAYTTKAVLIMCLGDRNISAYNFIERTFKYTIKDVYIQTGAVLKTNIPVMSTVYYYLYGDEAFTNLLDSGGISTVDGVASPIPTPGPLAVCTISVIIVDIPSRVISPSTTQELSNGVVIFKEYAPGNSLTVLKVDGTPCLRNQQILSTFVYNNGYFQNEPFDSESGAFDHSEFGGFNSDNNPGIVTFDAYLPV